MRHISTEKSYTKGGGETISGPFLKAQNWAYLWINIVGYRNILKLSCRPLAFTSFKVFLKNKKRYETSLPVSFPVWFLKKKKLHF